MLHIYTQKNNNNYLILKEYLQNQLLFKMPTVI